MSVSELGSPSKSVKLAHLLTKFHPNLVLMLFFFLPYKDRCSLHKNRRNQLFACISGLDFRQSRFLGIVWDDEMCICPNQIVSFILLRWLNCVWLADRSGGAPASENIRDSSQAGAFLSWTKCQQNTAATGGLQDAPAYFPTKMKRPCSVNAEISRFYHDKVSKEQLFWLQNLHYNQNLELKQKEQESSYSMFTMKLNTRDDTIRPQYNT